MRFMLASRVARWIAGVVCVLVLAAAFAFYASRDPRAEVVEDAGAPVGWKVIDYEGVHVAIPADWDRLDQGDCEFRFERWAAPGTKACAVAGGVAFYGSATFDPADGPGVRRNKAQDEPRWGGYAYAGKFAVYASDDERAVVRKILASAKSEQ